jgi:RimJ/RimL family protein N-acetyltransferase
MVKVPEALVIGVHGLVLRRWTSSDARSLLAAVQFSQAELRSWMPWASAPATLASVEEFLAGLRDQAGTDLSLGFGLFDAGGEVVGGFGLHGRRGPGTLEIGYWVRSDRTGRGYATAAARRLTDAAFECFSDVDRVEIRCDPANRASAAIPPKLGYALDREEVVPIEAAAQTGRQLVWAVCRACWPPPDPNR